LDTEIAVIGAGVMGTAAALELTRRGHQVLVLEQFEEGHTRGSSHGATRIFRVSYQDPIYVSLAQEALGDWERLERDTRSSLIETTGGLDVGENAPLCAEALTEAGVDFEELSGDEVAERFGLKLPSSDYAVFQKDSGVIDAARTLTAQTKLASAAGAQFRYGTKVISISQEDSGAVVSLHDGEVRAERILVSAGGWTRSLMNGTGIQLPLEVTKQQIAYFSTSSDMPVVIDWVEPARYLVPHRFSAPGIKVGLHHHGEVVDPDDGPFEVTDVGIADVTEWITGLTGEVPTLLGRETCLYTNAPDKDFVFVEEGPLLVVSACSGHGFKFGPRIGRAVADLIEGGDPGILNEFIWRDGAAARL
jgi:sarcosine oxidase